MKFSQYDSVTDPSPEGWLLIAELQPDGSYITKKVDPATLGPQGSVGPQGVPGPAGSTGPAGAMGLPGAPGTNGTNGTNGATGATGATGPAGSAGQNEVTNLDGHAIDTFEDSAVVATQLARTDVGWSGSFLATGSSIVTRSLIIGTEQRLSISGGEVIRQLGFSSRWNKIQIALLVRINGGVTFTAEYFFGLCSGVLNGYGSATCVNSIGVSGLTGNSNQFVFAATNAGLHNQFTANFIGFESKRGAVVSNQTGGSGSAGRTYSATESWRSLFVITIERGIAATPATSVSYTITAQQTNFVAIDYDVAKREFLEVIQEGAPTTLGVMTGGAQSAAFAFDESTGILDSLDLYWPAATPLEISAMSVRKVF